MTETPDAELLEQFARAHSESAFAALVERHLALVHSVALRHTADPQHAQDITQAAFIILARKAGSLNRKTVLPGWLYNTARLTAANFQRAEHRRIRREQEAYMQSTLTETSPADWEQLAPLLDEAMASLGDTDRNVVALRFFEKKTAQEIGHALKLNEQAVHKRATRAMEKMRKFFVKRGVAISGAAISGAVLANSVQAAPVGLAKTISAVAVAKGAAATTSTLTLVKGALKLMAWTKTKTAIVAGVAMLLVAGTATVVVNKMSHPIPHSVRISADHATGEFPPGPRVVGPDHGPDPHGVGPGDPMSRPNPNARFAELTPEQRVEQARHKHVFIYRSPPK